MECSNVDLGFVEANSSWKLASRFFPSKIGGKPAWLDLLDLPSTEDLKCQACFKPLVFLCQVYAPLEEDDSGFHRTLFIFICRSPNCCVINDCKNLQVFRCQLSRLNPFYSYDPPVEVEDWAADIVPEKFGKLCRICGARGTSHCARCKAVNYCSKEHQTLDWKAQHKLECGFQECPNNAASKASEKFLLPQLELVMEREKLIGTDEEHKEKTEEEKMEEFEQLGSEGKLGTLQGDSSVDPELMKLTVKEDRQFQRFSKRISSEPEQVLRYERGGHPLWMSSVHVPTEDDIPPCRHCGGRRQFEFQILPQLLNHLGIDSVGKSIDWGTLAVYTCKDNCLKGPAYKTEFIWKQDVLPDEEDQNLS